MPPPNILLITTDEQNARCAGYAGDPVIRTPNVDRLAREGMVFHRAYTTQPLCTPARASVWTGQHVTTHGVTGNIFTGLKKGIRAGTVTVSRLLQAAGYETALIGKRHLGFENEDDIALDHQDLAESKFDFNPPGMTDDYRRWLADQGYSKEEIETWVRPDMQEDYTRNYGAIRFPLEERYYVDSYVGRQSVEYLRGRGDRPFFLWVSFCSPHHPWDPPKRYDQMYDPQDIVLPERSPEELENKPFSHRIRAIRCARNSPLPHGWGAPGEEVQGMIDDPVSCPSADEIARMIPEDTQRRMIARYYGTITLVDDRIGDILDTLEGRRLLDETIIVFASDHGDHLGEHYLWLKGGTMYESLVRVPFIVRIPGGRVGGRECRELVSLFDLAPTFLQWAGVDRADTPEAQQFRRQLDGRSFHSLLEHPETPIHEELFIGTRAIVTRRWKYVWNRGDRDELYDLQHDPKELDNLSGAPEHAATEEQLRSRLFERFGIRT
jgi:arylsulfatase A-like enzyme